MPGSDLDKKAIRDTVKALLLGNTDADDKVYTSRINKAFLEELPGIFIWTPRDTPQSTRKMDQDYNRICEVKIAVIVAEENESQVIQDEVDIITGQIEDLLLPNIYLQNPPPWVPPAGPKIVNYIQHDDSNSERADEIKEDTYGTVMDFICEYFYVRATLTDLQDFQRFGHDYKVNGQTAENLTEVSPP